MDSRGESDMQNLKFEESENIIETGKRRNCDALQLEDRTAARQSFLNVFGQMCTTHAQKLLSASFRSKF